MKELNQITDHYRDAGDEENQEVARAARTDWLTRTLPNGYETDPYTLGEIGRDMLRVEWQLLLLARARIGNGRQGHRPR